MQGSMPTQPNNGGRPVSSEVSLTNVVGRRVGRQATASGHWPGSLNGAGSML
jgi:hypothetical protein